MTWWVANCSFVCRVCFVCFFTVLPYLDNTNARHSYNTPPINTWKKYLYWQLTVYCALLYTQCALPSAQCSLITAPLLIAHNSHAKHNYSLLTTHTQRTQLTIQNSQLITPHERRQRSLLHALSPLRPTSSHLMNRKFFLCLSRVFRLFLHCSASSRQHKRKPHSYNTLSSQRVKKIFLRTTHKSLLLAHYLKLSAHFSLLHYSLLTIHNAQHTTHYSQLITHFQRGQRALLHALLPLLRPTSPSACDLWISSFSFACRVWFVSSLFCLISISQTHAIFIQHPSHQRVKKKLTTHPTANYSLFTTCNSLCTTQYYLLIDYCSLIKATRSLLLAHYSLLIVHYSHTYFSILTTHHPPFFSQLILTAHYSILTTYNSLLSIY